MFIDRSPESFQYIYSHLQGYHIEIPNGDVFTRVFSDSIYYNLPRLKEILAKDDYYYIQVMNECIKLPKQLLHTAGNYPNFFNITFEALYRDMSELLIAKSLIRPPPQAAPRLNRDPGLLKNLIQMLQGVELDMTPSHRKALLKEARYYRFNGLVEKLCCVKIVKKPFSSEELIVVDYKDVSLKNFTIVDKAIIDEVDSEPVSKKIKLENQRTIHRTVQYERKFIDGEISRILIVEIDTPEILADINKDNLDSSTAPATTNILGKVYTTSKIASCLSKYIDYFKKITNYEFGNHQDFKTTQDGGMVLDSIRIEYQQDCQGNLRFPEVDFKYSDTGMTLSSNDGGIKLDRINEIDQLLFTKSYWKLNVLIDDDDAKFYVEFVPVKIEAVLNNNASLYSCLI